MQDDESNAEYEVKFLSIEDKVYLDMTIFNEETEAKAVIVIQGEDLEKLKKVIKETEEYEESQKVRLH